MDRQQVALEFEADREHVERQRDLRQAVNARHDVGAEQPGRGVGSQPAEERGPEEEARDHLRDHLRLTEPPGDQADELARADDRREQQEHVERELGVRHVEGGQYTPGSCPTGSACSRTVRRCGSWPTSSRSSPESALSVAVPTTTDDWFFDGHFPGEPVVPAIVLVELLAQTGGLAIGSGAAAGEPLALRVAALGGFKFPGAAIAGDVLEATARVVGRMGGLYKIEGDVTANGRVVGVGAVTLAEARR